MCCMACGPGPPPQVAMATLMHFQSNPYTKVCVCLCVYYYVLCHRVTVVPSPPQEPTPLRFIVWLVIPKPMVP